MDFRLSIVSNDGGRTWPADEQSSASGDDHSIIFCKPWQEPLSEMSTYTWPTSEADQLSPLSTGMPPFDTASAPAMDRSASFSSCEESWGLDLDGNMMETGEDVFGHAGVDSLHDGPRLKRESPDHDVGPRHVQPAPASLPTTPPQTKAKRPRGRPRKHAHPTAKVTKGRSKTGCLTCRKRKKKCDEAKPRCMNCEKNSVVCEGYLEKHVWRSGKEKAEEERMKRDGQSMFHGQCSMAMPPIFHGLETAEDMVFWKHYNDHLSNVLTVEGGNRNAFKDMMIPMAVKHPGLMHAILSMSGKHIDYDSPYGSSLLQNNTDVSRDSLQERYAYHRSKSLETINGGSEDHFTSAHYGQILCLLLESMVSGNPNGEPRLHLNFYKTMMQIKPPEDPAFGAFISEMFEYHMFADELVRLPRHDSSETPHVVSIDDRDGGSLHAPRLLGVTDGLFNLLSQVTALRNTMRHNLQARGVDNPQDHDTVCRAATIHSAIRSWSPRWPAGDGRERVGLLYKQMTWVYLFRTVWPLSPAAAAAMMVANKTYGEPVHTPPYSTSPSRASSPRRPSLHDHLDAQYGGSQPPPSPRWSNPPSRKNSESEHDAMSSPADERVMFLTRAVDEALDLLGSFEPSDPCQTLLLMPCVVIGAACFTASQRTRVREAVRAVRTYTGLRYADLVAMLLEDVWRLMDAGDFLAAWDWHAVAEQRISVDFPCA